MKTLEEGQRVNLPKWYEYNNKDEPVVPNSKGYILLISHRKNSNKI